MVDYFKKRKLKKQLYRENPIVEYPSGLGGRFRDVEAYKEHETKRRNVFMRKEIVEKAYKPIHSVFGFIDNPDNLPASKRKGKRKNPFGKIKDRSMFEGGFW